MPATSAEMLDFMFGPELEYADGTKVKTAEYVNSAPGVIVACFVSWCHHCRKFSPQFKEYMGQRPGKYVVILIPSEDNERQFREYQKTMPWPAVSFEHGYSTVSPRLMQHLEFPGFPSAAAYDSEGKMLTRDVTDLVRGNQELPDPMMPDEDDSTADVDSNSESEEEQGWDEP